MADANETPTIEPQIQNKPPLSLLASEIFGSEFHGEVKKPNGTETTTTEEAVETETETDTETETAETATTETAETETTTEEDIAAIIRQNLDADPALLQKIKLATKIDGQTGEATLDDLIRSYQIQSAAEKRLEEAKSKAKEMLDEASGKVSQLDERFAVAAKLIERSELKMLGDMKKADLDKLRIEDPAEWAARNQEFDRRRTEIEQDKLDAVTAYRAAVEKVREQSETNLRKHIQTEMTVLLDKLPEWRDAEKAKAGKAKLAEYLVTQGFTQQDVMGASDHRLILMARKAMLFDELQANTNAAAKKVAKVPKVLKPGAPKPPDTISKERIDKARSKLRGSGSLNDAYAVLKAKRGGK